MSQSWTVKNLVELKNARDVMVEGNTIENNWASGQQGYSILFTPRNQSNTAPWVIVKNITIQNNVIRHVAAVFNVLGYDDLAPSLQTQDITVRNNLIYDVSSSYATPNHPANGRFAIIGAGPKNITFDHNTVDNDGSSTVFIYGGKSPTGVKITGFELTNNLLAERRAERHDDPNADTHTHTDPAPGVSTPYGGTAPTLSGKVEFENYDAGGQDIAYYDTTATNAGGAYRTNAVDIKACTDTGGGYLLGWTHAGEWLNYTVNVAAAGTYAIDVRLASNGVGGTFHIEVNGVNKTGPMSVPNTGGWQVWKTVTKTGVALAAGPQVIRLVMDTDGASGSVANFNWWAVR